MRYSLTGDEEVKSCVSCDRLASHCNQSWLQLCYLGPKSLAAENWRHKF